MRLNYELRCDAGFKWAAGTTTNSLRTCDIGWLLIVPFSGVHSPLSRATYARWDASLQHQAIIIVRWVSVARRQNAITICNFRAVRQVAVFNLLASFVTEDLQRGALWQGLFCRCGNNNDNYCYYCVCLHAAAAHVIHFVTAYHVFQNFLATVRENNSKAFSHTALSASPILYI